MQVVELGKRTKGENLRGCVRVLIYIWRFLYCAYESFKQLRLYREYFSLLKTGFKSGLLLVL